MKKLIILSIGAVALMANLSSCKKGENDPFLSLSSRKARIAGEWTVTKEDGTSTWAWASDGITTTTVTTSTYNGTDYSSTSTSTITPGGLPPVVNTETYVKTTSLTFEKDGTFKMETVYAADATTETSEGTWAFVSKSKTAELKNKEAIILSYLKSTTTSGGTSTTTYTGFNASMVMVIDQLKNKEMIFIIDNSYNSSDGYFGSDKSTITLTAK